MKSIRPTLRVALALCLASAAAPAQSITWLEPGRWTASTGGRSELRVTSERASATTRTPWTDVDLGWFYIREAGEHRNFDAVDPEPGADFVSVDLGYAGATLIGMDRRPRIENIPGAELVTFLETRASTSALTRGWRARLAGAERRVRRVESAKLLVGVSDPGAGVPRTHTATSKAGQPCEIRLLMDPTVLRAPSDLPVRVYLPGGSAGLQLHARHDASGRTQAAAIDARGLAHFTVDVAGVWSLEAHRIVELTGDPEADLELHSATIRFQIPREGR
jgi:hypothetical protein